MTQRRLAIFDFDGTLARVPEKPVITPEASAAVAKLRHAKAKQKSAQKGTNADRKRAALEMRNTEEKVHELLGGWDGADWWGSQASLSEPHYDKQMNDEVVDAMRQARVDPETRVVMLTGRRGVVAHDVRNVLQHHGLVGKRQIPDSNQKALDHHQGGEHPEEDHHHAHDEFYSGDHRTEANYPKNPKSGKPKGDTWTHKTYAVKNLMHAGIEIVETWDDRADHVIEWHRLGKELLKKWPNLKTFTIHRVFNTPSGHYVQSIPVK